MLYNLRKLRSDYNHDQIISHINTIRDCILYHDQDVVNSMFHGHILELPISMNTRPFFFAISKKNARKIKNKSYIIHYAQKPWNDNFIDMAGDVFWKYGMRVDPIRYQNWVKENNEFKNKNRLRIIIINMKRALRCWFYLKNKVILQ